MPHFWTGEYARIMGGFVRLKFFFLLSQKIYLLFFLQPDKKLAGHMPGAPVAGRHLPILIWS